MTDAIVPLPDGRRIPVRLADREPAPHPEGPAHRWARVDAAGIFQGYADGPDEGVIVAPLSPEMAPGRWQVEGGRWQAIRYAHLDETDTLVGIFDEPSARSVVVPGDTDLDSQRGRQRWSVEHGRFEPRSDANDPAVVMVALDSLAPRALAHLIIGLARDGKPDAYAVEWARNWLTSFDADQAERKAAAALGRPVGFVPPQFRG